MESRNAMKKNIINVRVGDKLLDFLNKKSLEAEKSRSEYIRYLIEKEYEKEKA